MDSVLRGRPCSKPFVLCTQAIQEARDEPSGSGAVFRFIGPNILKMMRKKS